jgi:hypothetical protein
MVALLFSAYAIVITFFADNVFQAIKDKEEGKVLINSLNASFCLYLLASVVGIVIMFITSIISSMKIECTYAAGMNYFVYWVISFMLTYFQIYNYHITTKMPINTIFVPLYYILIYIYVHFEI